MVDASTLNEHIVACIAIIEGPILENALGLVISPHKSFILFIYICIGLLVYLCAKLICVRVNLHFHHAYVYVLS